MVHKVKIDNQEVYPVGIGTWKMGDRWKEKQEIEAIRVGIETGAQVIDSAENYGNGRSEKLVGQAIQTYNRESLYLVSKVLPYNASKTGIPSSLDQTLKNMNTDYLDLYLLHWPGSIPLEETIEAMEDAKAEGKIKAWGVSNFDADEFDHLLSLPNGKNCRTNQVKYSVIYRGIEFDLIPQLKEQQTPLMAYSPIVKGKFERVTPEQQMYLEQIAKNHDATIQQILIAWSIRNRNTISIPKTSNPKHMKQNISAANIQLTQEEMTMLDKGFPKPTSKESLALW